MKIRILVGFDGYTAGQVFPDWPSGMCELLIARGMIEEVKDEPVRTALAGPEKPQGGKRK
jgi:hypothetical protein